MAIYYSDSSFNKDMRQWESDRRQLWCQMYSLYNLSSADTAVKHYEEKFPKPIFKPYEGDDDFE